jgi:diguanylate cyclase (GGDEF)-like protein
MLTEKHVDEAPESGLVEQLEPSARDEDMQRGSGVVSRSDCGGARLTVLRGPLQGAVIELDGQGEVTLGRSDQAQVVIPDLHLSRVHARVFPRQTPAGIEFCIEDCGSANGTFVADRRISSVAELTDGAWVSLGKRTVLCFSLEASPEGEGSHLALGSPLVDPLTGVYNRVAFEDYLRGDFTRSCLVDSSLAVLLFEADRFESLSEAHGHSAAEFLLRQVVQTVQETLRRQDVLGRYSGGQFAAILHAVTRPGAREMAELARSRVEELELSWDGSILRSTLSVGGGYCTICEGRPWIEDATEMLGDAYAALREARAQGGNCIVATGWDQREP